MNEESNSGSKKYKPRKKSTHRAKGHELDMLAASPYAGNRSRKNMLEVLITEEEIAVWQLLAEGKTGADAAKELGIHPTTAHNRMNRALEKLRGWSGKQAEDWRNHQLLIIEKQISHLVEKSFMESKAKVNADGEQEYTKAGVPIWELSPTQAGKLSNMASQTLGTYLDRQAKLLNLLVDRKEVSVDQKIAIAYYDFGAYDDAASMEDL